MAAMSHRFTRRTSAWKIAACVLLAVSLCELQGRGADEPTNEAPAEKRVVDPQLTSRQWSQLDHAVDAGLQYLSTQQATDGSFHSPAVAQPAVTSFCIMAFLSRGYTPNQG